MKRILVTGATGNVGTEVVHKLYELNDNTSEIIVAVRNLEKSKAKFVNLTRVSYRFLILKTKIPFLQHLKILTYCFCLDLLIFLQYTPILSRY